MTSIVQSPTHSTTFPKTVIEACLLLDCFEQFAQFTIENKENSHCHSNLPISQQMNSGKIPKRIADDVDENDEEWNSDVDAHRFTMNAQGGETNEEYLASIFGTDTPNASVASVASVASDADLEGRNEQYLGDNQQSSEEGTLFYSSEIDSITGYSSNSFNTTSSSSYSYSLSPSSPPTSSNSPIHGHGSPLRSPKEQERKRIQNNPSKKQKKNSHLPPATLEPTKPKKSATLQPTKPKKSAKNNTTQSRQRQKDDNDDDNDDDDNDDDNVNNDNDECVGFKKADDEDEELLITIRHALPIPTYPKARHNAEKEEDKGNKPNAQMMHHMRELWSRFLTIIRALEGPNRDLCHGPRYRIEGMSEWPKIKSADKDKNLWNALIQEAYECRTEFVNECRECGVENPELNQVMPLNQLSDIGPRAWKYLKDYAKSDMDNAIYVPEVISALTSKGLVWEPGKTIISESMLM
jgi:hypothetical protein